MFAVDPSWYKSGAVCPAAVHRAARAIALRDVAAVPQDLNVVARARSTLRTETPPTTAGGPGAAAAPHPVTATMATSQTPAERFGESAMQAASQPPGWR
jgi:hypothetical protein